MICKKCTHICVSGFISDLINRCMNENDLCFFQVSKFSQFDKVYTLRGQCPTSKEELKLIYLTIDMTLNIYSPSYLGTHSEDCL